jgi:hypothetical protein
VGPGYQVVDDHIAVFPEGSGDLLGAGGGGKVVELWHVVTPKDEVVISDSSLNLSLFQECFAA